MGFIQWLIKEGHKQRSFASLYWTFVAAFITVLVVAVLLQTWLTLQVVKRVTDERIEKRAHALIQQTREELESLATHPSNRPSNRDVVQILERFSSRDRNLILLFKHPNKQVLPDRHLPPPLAQSIMALLEGDWILVLQENKKPPPRPARKPPPPEHAAERGRRAPPPPPPPPPREDEIAELQDAFQIAAEKVRINDDLTGELIAVQLREAGLSWPFASDNQLFMFIPVALLVAGGGGLILFRLLLRRLRRLEHFATRLTQGDLAARIEVAGNDEIDHLGERLNSMAEALSAARTRVELNEQQRSQLLADITHELGTPLTSIRGYAETLLNPAVPKTEQENQHYLSYMLREAKRMDALIQDLLELARLEAESTPADPELLDWTALCLNTVLRFEPRFKKAGIALLWQGGQEPAWILAEGRRMEQVIDNLLVNALRYVSSGGHVMLSVQRNLNQIFFRIEDDGPGVPAQALHSLFNRFYRAEDGHGIPGTGLGLAIVKEIITKHAGSIRAENRQPQGLRIIIELPGYPQPPGKYT